MRTSASAAASRPSSSRKTRSPSSRLSPGAVPRSKLRLDGEAARPVDLREGPGDGAGHLPPGQELRGGDQHPPRRRHPRGGLGRARDDGGSGRAGAGRFVFGIPGRPGRAGGGRRRRVAPRRVANGSAKGLTSTGSRKPRCLLWRAETMYGRLTRFDNKSQGEDEQEAIRKFEQNVARPSREVPGFRGLALMLNREEGNGITIAYWDYKAALDASAEQMKQLRNQAVADSAGSMKVTSVESGEVVSMERDGDPRAGTFARVNTLDGKP